MLLDVVGFGLDAGARGPGGNRDGDIFLSSYIEEVLFKRTGTKFALDTKETETHGEWVAICFTFFGLAKKSQSTRIQGAVPFELYVKNKHTIHTIHTAPLPSAPHARFFYKNTPLATGLPLLEDRFFGVGYLGVVLALFSLSLFLVFCSPRRSISSLSMRESLTKLEFYGGPWGPMDDLWGPTASRVRL
jgi:hypothetical protein